MFIQMWVMDGPVHKGKIFKFEQGETAVVGPNGCGKSLLAEYMAFLLFGSVALRGKVSDYKDLKVDGKVRIKNSNYQITRSTKDCKISNDLGLVCTGTKPCNLKIISLLGYDYNVYKMCNYAEQLDILGLGKMKPAERKSALDKTLGIGIVDKLVKYCTENGLKYKHEAEGVKMALQEPGEKPSRPASYRESNTIAIEYQEEQKRITEYEQFRDMPQPVLPTEPVFPEGLEGCTSFGIATGLKEKAVMESTLKSYREITKPVFDMQELRNLATIWDNYNKYLSYKEKIDLLGLDREPVMSIEEVEGRLSYMRELSIYQEQLKSYELGKVKCPDCGKEFNPYKDRPAKPVCIYQGEYTLKDLEAEKDRIQKKKMLADIPVVEEVKRPEISMSDIIKMQQDWSKWTEAQEIIPKIEYELNGLTYVTEENFNRLQRYETELELYQHLKTIYDRDKETYNLLSEKFKYFNHEKEVQILINLGNDYNASLQYETDLQIYETKYLEYMRLNEKVIELTCQEQKYREGADKLKEMKTKIKGYVLPSLQKVASLLLSEMSDGLYQTMLIDSDFNVLVEGREICLFSGSEQAMINLALRLGLGQVLTHKVFSVFIGDEIDASMRDERAQLTAECLRKVSKYIKQVILISHRDIEADNCINLGEK